MSLKIVTLNIHKGFNWSNTSQTLSLLKKNLSQLHPDIVFLQEVVGENKILEKKFDNYISNQFEYLAQDLWSDFSYSKHAVFDHRHHGNVILSKYPIISENVIDISENPLEKRAILHSQIQYQDKIIDCYCVHLNLLHKHRKSQYQQLLEAIESNRTDSCPILLAGDFNDWNARASAIFEKELNLTESFKSIHGRYAKTFPAFFPIMPLDRIYLDKFKISHSEVLTKDLWRSISDHLPIYLEVEVL